MAGPFGGEVVSIGNEPTRIGAKVPGQNVYNAVQSNWEIIPGWYRVYFSVSSNFTDFQLGIKIGPSFTFLIGGSNLYTTDNGYFDLFYPGGIHDGTLTFIMVGQNDTYEFTPHILFLCPIPEFDFKKEYSFQLPLYQTGNNQLPVNIGMPLSFADVHTGTINIDDTTGPPFLVNQFEFYNWDTPFMSYPVGYQGNLFFTWEIDAGSVTWGTGTVPPITIKTLTVYFSNAKVWPLPPGVDICDIFGNSFAHTIDVVDPSKPLKGCFKSTTNEADPITQPQGGLCVIALYEEDTATNTGRIQFELENMATSMFLMTTEYNFIALEDTFYRLQFRNNNTSQTTVEFFDSLGNPILATVSDGLDFQAIFNTGTLPVDQTVTIRFTFEDVLECESDNFDQTMLTNVSLYQMGQWDAELYTVDGCDGDEFAPISGVTLSTPQLEGETYNQNAAYFLDLEAIPPGCYKVRIFGEQITDSFREYYDSQCLKVCDAEPDLCYFEWDPDSLICVGTGVIDYEAYSEEKYGTPNFWVRCDLQDLTIEDNRNVYTQSTGFSKVYYVEQFATYILQIWDLPEYVRRALIVGTMNQFKINGRTFQKLDDESYQPQFSTNPNSPIRFNVREIGDFSITNNKPNC